MKNYYEILEVDKNASPEVIEKAYKTLVKKYHPDLQQAMNKSSAEEMIKKINEAYDVLSNKEKREEYNIELANKLVDINKYNMLLNENSKLKNELNQIKKNIQNYNKTINDPNTQYTSQNNNSSINNHNHYNYIPKQQYTRHYYSPSQQPLSFKDKLKYILKNFISLLLTFFIIFIVFQLPFFKNIFLELNLGKHFFIFLFIFILFLYFINKGE